MNRRTLRKYGIVAVLAVCLTLETGCASLHLGGQKIKVETRGGVKVSAPGNTVKVTATSQPSGYEKVVVERKPDVLLELGQSAIAGAATILGGLFH